MASNLPPLREGHVRCPTCLQGRSPQGMGRHRDSAVCLEVAAKLGHVPDLTEDAVQSAGLLQEITRAQYEQGMMQLLSSG